MVLPVWMAQHTHMLSAYSVLCHLRKIFHDSSETTFGQEWSGCESRLKKVVFFLEWTRANWPPQTENISPEHYLTLSDAIWRYLTLSDEHHSPKTSQTYLTLSDAIWRWGPREAIVSRAHEGPIRRYLTLSDGHLWWIPIWRYLTGTRWWIHQPIWCYLTDPFPRVLCHQPPSDAIWWIPFSLRDFPSIHESIYKTPWCSLVLELHHKFQNTSNISILTCSRLL